MKTPPPDTLEQESLQDVDAKPRRRVTRRRVLLWLSLIFVVTILIGAAVLYMERLSLVERIFRNALAERGLDADLEVEILTTDKLVLRDVLLREDGREVLRARRVVAGYDLRRALDGDIRRVDMEGARIRIGLDEDFRITDGWLQPSGEGGPPILPYEGIGITDSEIDLLTPFGELDLEVEAEVAAMDSFTAKLALLPTTYDSAALRVVSEEAEFAVARAGSTLEVVGGTRLAELISGETVARDVGTVLEGEFDLDARVWSGKSAITAATGTLAGGKFTALDAIGTPSVTLSPFAIDGPVSASVESYASEQVEAAGLVFGSGDLDLRTEGGLVLSGPVSLSAREMAGFEMRARSLAVEGRVNRLDLRDEVTAKAALDITADRFAFEPARAARLADALSVSRVLGASPVARDFAPGLTAEVRRALSGGTLDAGLALDIEDGEDGENGASVTLTRPATLSGARNVRVSPVEGQPAYTYDPATDEMGVVVDASLDGPRAVRVNGLELEAQSYNGVTIEAVTGVSGRIRTRAWQATTPDGRTTALDPMDVRLDSSPGRTRIVGGLVFSGDIPGGYVKGLRTEGTLVLRPGGRLQTDYATDAPLTFDRLTLTNGARVEGFSAMIASEGPLFTGTGDDGDVAATLREAAFRYLYEADGTPQDIGITADALDIEGRLTELAQNWAVDAKRLAVETDTLIGPGTTAEIEEAALTARLVPDQPLQFTFASPSLRADTALAKVRDMQVDARGTTEDFEVDYASGRVRTSNETVPVLPLEGTARFRQGRWTGKALAALPQSPEPPVDIAFDYADGNGTARILVDDLRFSPDGLQPQSFIPALTGKVSQVDGTVDAEIDLTFENGEIVGSPAIVTLNGLNAGTAPGPFTGIETRLEFESILPLQSSGRQTATLDRFDPGIPLNDGTFEFEFIPEGIRVFSATWPLAGGEISLEPFTWTYGAEVNRAVLLMDRVPVSEFLEGIGSEAVQLSGTLVGRLPIEVRGIEVIVAGGRLEIPEGGTLRYETAQTDTASSQAELTQMAFDALREFDYDRFGLSVDGPLDGEITIDLVFSGKVGQRVKLPLPKWARLQGEIPFVFDISVTGELFNILKSFDQGQYVQRGLEQLAPGLRDSVVTDEETVTKFKLNRDQATENVDETDEPEPKAEE